MAVLPSLKDMLRHALSHLAKCEKLYWRTALVLHNEVVNYSECCGW